jgi:hypothetical protein
VCCKFISGDDVKVVVQPAAVGGFVRKVVFFDFKNLRMKNLIPQEIEDADD